MDDPSRWPQGVYPVVRPLGLLPILQFYAMAFQNIRDHSMNALLVSGALLCLMVCMLALTGRLSLCVRSTRPLYFRVNCHASTGAVGSGRHLRGVYFHRLRFSQQGTSTFHWCASPRSLSATLGGDAFQLFLPHPG